MSPFAPSLLPASVIERRLEAWLTRLRESGCAAFAVELWNGHRVALDQAARVTIRLRTPRALAALWSPDLARIGEAYVEGVIDVIGHPLDAIEAAARLSDAAGGTGTRQSRPRRHTRAQDSSDIQYHYDVSNDFYRAWLDPEMVYSCAYFRRDSDRLATAQIQKLDHILTKLRVRPGERLLDIGCGWGALIVRAARDYGARCTGITLSQNQYDLARERIREAGVEDRCEVRLMDYRDLSGRFDKITSVGMFEHVGLKQLPAYFRTLHALLDEGGIAMNHGITSADPDSGETPLGGGRFIDRYVFPNGELPHLSLVIREMSAAGLEVQDVESLRRHYALTLRHWIERFEAAGPRLREMVGDKRHRIWRAYLAGCAFGFSQGWMGLHQIVATRRNDPVAEHDYPLTREHIYGAR
ncbi:class I SAM-dependent methyltransferase [Nitrogeniibacter mangrovi]|uniref:Class I SAM-dependent methyltransferase n=1 Tax=Nitrogeniibacter mangrovi TaxID=2016596 RepID=A0A6C1B6E8_9RHOO|nr:cyclopropane-fatty-acyl-phospholipid synthase family protein [Nitrogeniibacter mangrovi]QID18365.1 class I SAM-dependent methyltransferase [Nitrogeniibacter mangrovi]